MLDPCVARLGTPRTHVRWMLVWGFALCAACGPGPSVVLPSITALTYRAPDGWYPAPPPRVLDTASDLHFISAFAAPPGPHDGATLALYSLTALGGFFYPETPNDRLAFASGVVDGPTFVRWRRLDQATVADAPAVFALAETTDGATYLWLVFGKRKLFVLELHVPLEAAGDTIPLRDAVLATVQVK